ncbi:hypothetical protein [Sphingomonas jeddahensis]|jgi:hypothetical protein|uniref:Uncharacterized protein n=1 Tax=Sphingomonas jeddahensis TaxID=1915074 RepID=A0A1V2ET72_9SPHN|nr:hypothetical protein [Sphingomonas jeddahensis]ONF95871.1 hypothetical protein SPHI_17970 [Sphingomonas jeddahensis]
MTDKQPMQADGAGTKPHMPDENGEVASRRHSSGESQGGSYPNPHTGKDGGGFDGGQTERGYHGTGRLGEQKTGEQPNSASSE